MLCKYFIWAFLVRASRQDSVFCGNLKVINKK
jgi:hypothetical protein